jgi:HK97 gp10 family phage protein
MSRIEFDPGLDEALGRRVDDFLNRDLGPMIVRDAKLYAPVDTGKLQSSITHEVVGHTLRVGSNAWHAPYQELGTRHNRAHPYLRPALYQVRF